MEAFNSVHMLSTSSHYEKIPYKELNYLLEMDVMCLSKKTYNLQICSYVVYHSNTILDSCISMVTKCVLVSLR